jgi:hypothetical protein
MPLLCSLLCFSVLCVLFMCGNGGADRKNSFCKLKQTTLLRPLRL